MRTRLLLAALAALSLTACGGGGGDAGALIDDGYRALSTGASDKAMADFEAARGQLKPGEARYLEAEMGYLRAQAGLAPGKAAEGFLKLAKTEKLSFTNYSQFVGDLIAATGSLSNEEKFKPAVAVLTEGLEKNPDDERWQKLLNKVGDAAKNAGATGAMKELEGLGYVGE